MIDRVFLPAKVTGFRCGQFTIAKFYYILENRRHTCIRRASVAVCLLEPGLIRENWREYEDRRKISDFDDDKKKKTSANNRAAHFQPILSRFICRPMNEISGGRRLRTRRDTRALHITFTNQKSRYIEANYAVKKEKK